MPLRMKGKGKMRRVKASRLSAKALAVLNKARRENTLEIDYSENYMIITIPEYGIQYFYNHDGTFDGYSRVNKPIKQAQAVRA